MDNKEQEQIDTHAEMDFKERTKPFQGEFKEKQPSENETMTPDSRRFQQKSDASAVKTSSPCKETEKANRLKQTTVDKEFLAKVKRTLSGKCWISSLPESPKETWGETSESSAWSSSDLEVFKHPMCLISAKIEENEDGEERKIILKSEQKVFEQIKKIDLPMVVVAVVGPCRTGNSYLMNCLASSFKGGVELGNTTQSQTKGIWVWCKMHPTQKNTVLVLLDTEGLGDVGKGGDQNLNNNLFTLTTLLCNCLVYNIKGAFDNKAFSKLTFVTEMAKSIRYREKSSEDNQMLNLLLPDFVLCMRDFTLELKSDGGESISANEYLERRLAKKKKKAAQYNKVRECIRKYFPKRECFAFPMPGDTHEIQNLEIVNSDALCESLQEATTVFVSYIYSFPPKEMSGRKPINGEIFVTLAERYVTAFRHGAVLDVDDAFTAAAKIENAKIEKQALAIFQNQMVKVIRPVPGTALRCLYTEAQQATLAFLRQNIVHDLQAECEYQAQRKMDKFWYRIKEDNDTKVQEMCKKKLDLAFKGYIEEKLKKKEYETAGGYPKFQRDVERLKEEYVSNLSDYEENEILHAWYGFIKCNKETEARIVEADGNLSKKEEEDEQRRKQEYIEQLLQEQQKAQQETLEKQRKDLEDHYKNLDEDRDEQLKADQAKYELLVTERLEKDAAQKEMKRYIKEAKTRKDQWFGARMENAHMDNE